ncbi:hypothetical protein [Rubritalea sp.]|uniref:hypothetical protein n=1 Tax=Rubritalea sp. TaxID=2109375 RepID=UPI003EF3FF69
MKTLTYIVLLSAFSLPLKAEEPVSGLPDFSPLKSRADYLLKEDDGTISYRGKYTIGDGGKIVRYDIYKESNNKLVQTDIPVYDSDGKNIMGKTYNADGELKVLVIIMESGRTVYLTPEGELLTPDEGAKLVDPRLLD